MILRNLSGKHFSSISRKNLAKRPNEVKTKRVLPGEANEEKSRRLNPNNRYLRKDVSTDKHPHNSRPLISAGRLNRQIKVEPNIGQSGDIYSVAGRIIRKTDDRKNFGGSIAAQMSATARYRQTRAATEETSVINPSSLSIPLAEFPHQFSDTSTQVETNENLVADSNNRECASEKSSNKLGKVLETEKSRNKLGKVGTVVLAGSAGLCYFYLFT